jgi:glycosyltransferase involved in cell wall biosynthesis
VETLVSIVMPVYQTEDFLEESMVGILQQDYSNWELLLILDGGPEVAKAAEWMQRFPDPRIRWFVSKRNRGLSRSRNLAMRFARGEWIAFCDSDDVWRPNKLQLQLQVAQQGKYNVVGSIFAFSRERVGPASEMPSLEYLQRSVLPKVLEYRTLLSTNALPMSSAMYNQYELGKHYFHSSLGLYHIHEDYSYWLEMFAKKQVRAHLLSKPLLRIRLRSNSRSSDKMAAMKAHASILLDHLGPGLLNRICGIYYLFNYMFWALTKRSGRWQPVHTFDWNR